VAAIGEIVIDLLVASQRQDAPRSGPMGRLYAARWEQPDPVRRQRLRAVFAAGLMALARYLSPDAYQAQLRRSAQPAEAGVSGV
jgi:hypothetical protein